MNDKIFKQDAKTIVDLFFDTKIFKDTVTRDNMNATEDYIESILRSRFDSYLKMNELTNKINKL
jgi:hypothetical protein